MSKGTDGTRSFSTIDFPGATSTIAVLQISNSGQIVGAQRDAKGVFHSLTSQAKSFLAFDPPLRRGVTPP